MSAIESVNDALVAAVERVDSAGGAPLATSRLAQPEGSLLAEIVVAAAPPNAAVVLQTRIPILRADTVVSPDHMPMPAYPRPYQQNHEGASVDFRYVVLDTGRADSASFELLGATYNGTGDPSKAALAFAASAMKAILANRFKPARVGGCRARSIVRQRISYVSH